MSRYVGIKPETTFGDETVATSGVVYSELAESSLDVKGDAIIELKKGFGRGISQIDKGVYIPDGDITAALTVALFPYFAYGIGGNYEYGDQKHYFWNTTGKFAPSYQVHVGKDFIEQVFVGSTISSLSFTCDKEYAEFTASMICKNDILNGEAKSEATIQENALNEVAIPFTGVTIKVDGTDYTSSKILNSLNVSIENNASGEDGVGLGDNYTKQIVLGETNSTVSFENLFTDDTFLTKFKSGGTHSVEIIFKDKNNKTVTFLFPAMFMNSTEQKPSGRDAIKQNVSFKALSGSVSIPTQTLNTEFLITVDNGEPEYTF